MTTDRTRRFERYVAIGDSSTEGLNDFGEDGRYIGWSRRLAAKLARAQGGLLYANFGVRGLTTREIFEQQLEPALAMEPDLVTLFSGTNDVMRFGFDARETALDVEHMQRAFIDRGAVVLTFTLPVLTPVLPLAAPLAPRIRAMNDAVRTASSRTGARLLDFAAYPVATDARLWHEDRIHANAVGHARIADALAGALELPGTSDRWSHDLPPEPAPTAWHRTAAEVSWWARYLVPWMLLGLRARILGDTREPARPALEPVTPQTVC